jgi:hypothetical protein
MACGMSPEFRRSGFQRYRCIAGQSNLGKLEQSRIMGAVALAIGRGMATPAVQVGSWVDPHTGIVWLECHLHIESVPHQGRCSIEHTALNHRRLAGIRFGLCDVGDRRALCIRARAVCAACVRRLSNSQIRLVRTGSHEAAAVGTH